MRLRAFGNFAFYCQMPTVFHAKISGHARGPTPWPTSKPVADLVLQNINNAIAGSGLPFLGPGGRSGHVCRCAGGAGARVRQIGLQLESVTVQNLSLPEELQKILDQKISMGMVGDDGKFMQYQTAQTIPSLPKPAAVVAALRATPWAWAPVCAGPDAGAEPAAGPARRRCSSQAAPAAAARGGRQARRRDTAGEAGRAQVQGHPHAGRVRRQRPGCSKLV